MKRKVFFISLLACFLVTLIFSAHFVIAKKMLVSHHPLSLTTLRGLFAGIIILLLFRKQINLSQIKKYKGTLFLIGALGFFGNQLLFMSGLKLTSSLNASIISNAVPMVTALIGIVLGIERYIFSRLLGIVIGFSSVLYIIFESQNAFSLSPLGDLLVFSNMFVFAIALVLIKKLTRQGMHFAIVTAIMMLVGASLASIIAGEDTLSLWQWSLTEPSRIGMLVFEVFISTVVAYLLNFYALKNLAPSLITVFIYLQPFITALTDFYLNGAMPETSSWPAFIGILIGGGMTLYSSKYSQLEANKSHH